MRPLSFLFSLVLLQQSTASSHGSGYRHAVRGEPVRHEEGVADAVAKRAASRTHTYTLITPSPDALPIAITTQYQVVTSYVSQLALCPLSSGSGGPTWVPPNIPVSNSSVFAHDRRALPFKPKRAMSLSNSTAAPPFPTVSSFGQRPPPFGNATYSTALPSASSAARLSPSPPYPTPANSSTPVFGTGFRTGSGIGTSPLFSFGFRTGTGIVTNPPLSPTPTSENGCTVHYSPTVTSICHTVLTGLATKYTVTDCKQLLTYSTQYGYTVALPAGVTDPAALPASRQPPIETVTTYSEAPWTALTAGTLPAIGIEKVCSRAPGAGAGQECVDYRIGYQTRVTTHVTKTTSHVDLTTTLPGPSRVVIETFEADITEIETRLDLQTRIVVEVSTEGLETTSSVLGVAGRVTVPAVEAQVTGPWVGKVTSTSTRTLMTTAGA